MDKELKEKWVAALRSGHYKQGKDWLRVGDTFCCWGVLRDLIDPADKEDRRCLPARHMVAAGLPPFFDTSKLESMNDGVGEWNGNQQNFAQIADYIERNL